MTKYYLGDQFRWGEVVVHVAHGRGEGDYKLEFGGEIWRIYIDHFEDLGMYGRIILKWMVKLQLVELAVDRDKI